MRTFIVSIFSILLSVALLLLGYGLTGTLLTLRSAQEGFSDGQIGLLMSAYFAGYILATGYASTLINVVGHIRLFAAVAALSSCLLLLQGLWPNFWFWLVARLLSGAAIFSFFLVVESWLNSRASPTTRGKVFSIYMFINLFSLAAAQQLILLGDISTLSLFAVAAIFFCLSVIPVSLTRIPQPEPIARSKLKLRDLKKVPPLSLLGALVAGIAGGAFSGMAPLFAHQLEMDTATVAAMMSITILSGAIFQWPVGILSDRMDRRRILLAICAVAVTTSFFAVFAYRLSEHLFLITMAIYGGAYLAIYPVCAAYANDGIDDGDYVAVGAGLLFSYGIGATVGPFCVGQAMALLGPNSFPLFLALCWGSLTAYIVYELWRHIPALDSEDASEFVPMVRTSQLALTVSLEEHNAEALAADVAESEPESVPPSEHDKPVG